MTAAALLATLALAALVHRPLLGHLGAGTLQHLARLPGNLLHEGAHALAMLATGYTVAGFSVSLTDRAGRGHVRPGPAWTRLARPWLTDLVSPVAPVFAGVAALAAIRAWCGAPGLPLSIDGALAAVSSMPWGRWELWVALLLAWSVTAELAPSGVDLAAWWRPALVAAGVAALVAVAAERWAPGSAVGVLVAVDGWARAPVAGALAMAVWSALACAPLAIFAGKLRGA